MENLRDLNELAKAVVRNFNEKFEAKDCIIPQSFKDKVRTLKSFSVVYNDYSVVIKGDGVRSKDSYVPNQCFYMASFFIEYSYELSKYKQKIMPWIANAGIPTSDLTAFFTHERDYGKKDIERGDDKFVKILDNIGYHDVDREYLIKFVTDYNWWSGSKTIERSDFFNSPVLSIMGLTASSNAAMALIVDHLTQHPEYNSLLLDHIEKTKITSMSNTSLQKIYFGTPGSGKSWTIKQEYEQDDTKVFRTTFHPDTDYASFVGCYKPVKDDEEEKKIVYEFVPQAFTDAYVAAWSDLDNPYYLIIEEINRGNCAQIFGDLFQLLDRNKYGYSEYPIKADHDLRDYLEENLPEDSEGIRDGKICLPPNLSIIASMNTSDQSLFPMDSAFKRRWSWEYVPIDYENSESGAFTITIGGETYNWHTFLKAVNKKIKAVTSSEDKQMGNFFIKSSVDEKEFCDKVMFYLWSEVGKDNYQTNDAIFKYYTEDDRLVEFSFNELYEATKKTGILKGFIRYIEEEK